MIPLLTFVIFHETVPLIRLICYYDVYNVNHYYLGLIYLPAVVMVGYYFEKKRAMATGKILSKCTYIKIKCEKATNT